MAPSQPLAKRLELSTEPLTKNMVGAIAGGAIFVACFGIGLGVFIYFYVKSARQFQAPHITPSAIFEPPSVLDADIEKKSINTISSPSATPDPKLTPPPMEPPPAQLELVIDTPPSSISPEPPTSTQEKGKLEVDTVKGADWDQQSRASGPENTSPTSGNELV